MNINQKTRKPISLVRLKIMWDLSEVVKIRISLCETLKRMALVIRSLCSTFHTIYIAMNYLFVVCSGGQRWKHSCGCQKMCESLSFASLLCVCASVFASVCYEKLWQTELDSVGGVNSITFFFFFFPFSQHIFESDSAQVLRPVRWTHIKRDILYVQD